MSSPVKVIFAFLFFLFCFSNLDAVDTEKTSDKVEKTEDVVKVEGKSENFLEWVYKNHANTASILTSLTALIGFLFAIKRKNLLRPIVIYIKRVTRVDLLEKISERIEYIDKELRFNGGGSLKDQVVKITHLMENDFILKAQPVFMCLEDGSNSQVSHAYCKLVGVDSISELQDLNWRMFIHPDDIDEYDRLWTKALHEKQGVVTIIGVRDQLQNERGRWRVRITPIKPVVRKVEEGYLFIGHFTPVDDLAKSIWDENGWNT